MKLNLKILGLAIIFIFAMSLATIAKAQEDTTDTAVDSASDATLSEEDITADLNTDQVEELLNESEAITTDEPEILEGVEAEEPTEVPSSFGLWWRGIKETVSLITAIDPVKKAEKQLRFAEERIKIANLIAEKSDDPATQEKAAKIIEKANNFLEKIDARKEKILENMDERGQKLFENIARHRLNKEKVLEKLEDKLPIEALDKFQKMREQVRNQEEKFMEKIEANPNIPAEVKEKLIEKREAVKEKAEARLQIREENKELLQKALSGDEAAKLELQNQQQERITERKETLQKAQKLKQGLIEAFKTGDEATREQAAEELKNIKVQGAKIIQNLIQKRENVLEKTREIKSDLRQDAKEGDAGALIKLKAVNQAEKARLENRVEARPLTSEVSTE